MRFFNTEGPVNCREHYCLAPLDRFDLDEICSLIQQKKYFLLHAPRQTGKTTCLLALMEYLNAQEKYRAVYANIEGAQAARENVDQGIEAVVHAIAGLARWQLQEEETEGLAARIWADKSPLMALEAFRTEWCAGSPRPTILLLNEMDALIGDTLISLLRQLRAGYPNRPGLFPQTVVLCGVRDIQDYRIHSSMKLKAWRDNAPDSLLDGLSQTDGYLQGLGRDTGWLIIFDRRSRLPTVAGRTLTEPATTPSGKSITVISFR